MGKRAPWVHVAGRIRALQTVRMKPVFAESSTVLDEVTSTVGALDRM
ncbi:MAG: hypothetical protein ACRBN8_15095 [Nannocystales bacterium]